MAEIFDQLGAPPATGVPGLIWRPCLCNRWEAQQSLDFPPGTDVNARVDRALLGQAENIEGQLKRVFYPSDDTRFWDWPQQGGAGPGGGTPSDPWRLVLDDNDLVCLTSLVAGGVTLGLDQLFLYPWSNPVKFRPYYSVIEIDRSTSASFGNQQQTPQNSIAVTATWGYGADADLVCYLAAAVGGSDTLVTVTDGSRAGPGDLLVLGYGRGSTTASAPHAGAIAPYAGERVLITDASPVATGLTQSGSGVTTAEDSDQALTWTGTGQLSKGEVITLDSEDMFVEKILGSVATVRRAFNGTTLAGHSGAAIWAMRQYSVNRAQLGTTAASYSSGAAVCRHRVPQLVRDLSIAEVANQLLQEGSGYARTTGSGENAAPAPGIALVDKWAEARTRHGRGGKARQRAV
jgi:hypothetical protein